VLLFAPRGVLILPGLVLAVAALLVHRRLLVPIGLGLIVVAGPVMGFNVPWQRLTGAPGTGFRLRVLTCNLHHTPGDLVALDHLIARTQPDVVTFQEWRQRQIPATLSEPGWHSRDGRPVFVASRHPIGKAEILSDNSTGRHGLVARYELATPGGTVTFFSVHLATPRSALSQVSHDVEEGALDMQANTDLRATQLAWLADHARQAPGRVILAGDFNTPPESAVFRQTWSGFTDAFAAGGWGWGYTFLTRRTQVRIDHVLAGPGWACERCWVGANVGSPHRPVIADLVGTGGDE
jgi:endonuclease/exonuclease/phosphatase (EEP) superfamily protein YafD